MFIGRVNSRVNISECVFSFNDASGRGGVAALIGSSLFLIKTNIFNNTAEYGDTISACNSVVMVMEDALFTSPDPVYSFCTLYDGHIVHYHISPPVDPELTPSPSTTQQMNSHSIIDTISSIQISTKYYSASLDLLSIEVYPSTSPLGPMPTGSTLSTPTLSTRVINSHLESNPVSFPTVKSTEVSTIESYTINSELKSVSW